MPTNVQERYDTVANAKLTKVAQSRANTFVSTPALFSIFTYHASILGLDAHSLVKLYVGYFEPMMYKFKDALAGMRSLGRAYTELTVESFFFILHFVYLGYYLGPKPLYNPVS